MKSTYEGIPQLLPRKGCTVQGKDIQKKPLWDPVYV